MRASFTTDVRSADGGVAAVGPRRGMPDLPPPGLLRP
jgi:hypothetical protein